MAEVMGALGDRWGTLIMRDLLLGLKRYEDLRQSTGITNATLSDRLKALEMSGLVERSRYQVRPDRYEYLPTEKGRDLALVVHAMLQIGDRWRSARGDSQPLRIVDGLSGRDLKLALVDAETGGPVAAAEVVVEAGSGVDDAMLWRITRGEGERQRRRLARAM